jgi:hypothetical protein
MVAKSCVKGNRKAIDRTERKTSFVVKKDCKSSFLSVFIVSQCMVVSFVFVKKYI